MIAKHAYPHNQRNFESHSYSCDEMPSPEKVVIYMVKFANKVNYFIINFDLLCLFCISWISLTGKSRHHLLSLPFSLELFGIFSGLVLV